MDAHCGCPDERDEKCFISAPRPITLSFVEGRERRFVRGAFVCIMLLTLFCAANICAQTVASGTTGDCTWTLTGPEWNYTLTIEGDGAMGAGRPWFLHYFSNITSLLIGDGVTSIGNEAFSGLYRLTSVTIGKSVTSIGESAFSQCTSLIEVTNRAVKPQAISPDVFGRGGNAIDRSEITLYVPAASVAAYKSRGVWSKFVVASL